MSHSLNTRRRKARKKKNETRLEMNKKKKKKMCTSIVELIHYDVSGTPMVCLEKAMHVVLQEILGFHSIPILVLSIAQFVSQFPAMKHINLIKVKTKEVEEREWRITKEGKRKEEYLIASMRFEGMTQKCAGFLITTTKTEKSEQKIKQINKNKKLTRAM